MEVTPVGSETWRDASYQKIRKAQSLNLHPGSIHQDKKRSSTQDNKSISLQPIPPPFHRDLIANKCNAYVLSYIRETRRSVFTLSQVLWETASHIQRLQREREILQKSHANTRRDIEINNETMKLRSCRPMSERFRDQADVLLQEEQSVLLEQKRQMEEQLHEVSRQLKVLYGHRQKLSDFCKEKSQVLDFISENARLPSQKTPGISTLLGPESKDCEAAMNEALSACEEFQNKQPPNWQKPIDCLEFKTKVTQGLRQKAEESFHIREDVTQTMGDVRNAIQREHRLHEELEDNYQLQLGPATTMDLTVRERLDRPLVRIMQRHPGTQLPESILICQGSAFLENSLKKSNNQLGNLRTTQNKLREDEENKLWGERIDRTAVRLRQKKARGRRERLVL